MPKGMSKVCIYLRSTFAVDSGPSCLRMLACTGRAFLHVWSSGYAAIWFLLRAPTCCSLQAGIAIVSAKCPEHSSTSPASRFTALATLVDKIAKSNTAHMDVSNLSAAASS